ncbi:MAG TPA: tripartite tricarboxylate transporter substrate-binding protein [Burkholderiales bacterium]|nr:tripartite tricarboxylate transporter substrate-binding protein [Burkholderiales bacterium]
MLRVLLLVLLACALGDAGAQAWPVRPLRIIVSQAAGGTPDIICRIVTERVSRTLGQQLIVDNRPGSGNVIGAQAAARATADGYTLFFATAAALVTNPYTFKSLPYDPQRDFTPVGMVAKGPFFVLAHPSVPAKTLAELIAFDRAQPGKLTFATDGPRNFSGMLAAWINKLAHSQILQVPYANMPQGVQDTLAGRTQLVILAIPSAAPLMKRGDLRALAVSSARRAPGYEDVPPIADTFPGFDFIGWFVFVAPAGTPVAIVQRFNRELDRVLKDPAVAQRLADLGFYTEGADTPAATGEFVRVQRESWGKVVREIGMQPE